MAPRNPDEFDGYRKWLGIANKKRPPTHYELLAISLDEDDPEVIRAAAEQRRHYVETKRGDGHDTTVNEILYRIGEAEATLLNDEMRRDYDRQLNLFEKRRKNRQVDPFASPSRVRSQPGRTVGEDSGIVKTFVGIMVVVCVGFGGMAWFSFGLPWSKPEKQPEAVPVVQHALAPDSLPQSVEKPAQVPPAVAQVEPEPVNQTKLEDATGEAKRTLEGEWVCIANEQGGSSISEEAVRQEDRRVTINGSTFKMLRTRGTRGGYEGKFEIEASNGHFEFTGTPVGGGKFIYWFGVYQLDGDILKLSYRQKNNDQATRPTVFKTTGEDQDNPWVSGTYRRASTIAQANANVTYLVTLPRKNIHHHPNGWWSDKGELILGGENGNPLIRKPLVFDGKESKNSIYMSGLSSAEVFLTYTLNGKFENFEAIAYIPDMLPYQGNPRSPLVFKVVGDGRLLWKSNPLARKREQEPCKTSVAGVKELSLRIECQGADNWALASWIEPRLLGANAQTPATDMPEVATPVAAKDDGPIPEFLNLDEINSEEAEASPWISPDGLTLYWTAKEVGGKDGDDWIWSAIRKTPDARFEAKTKLFRGKFPVVSSDGLEMIFKPNDFDGFSVATRKTASEPFARPRQITELSIAGSYSKPRCLSYNGRSLYFDRDKANGKNNDTWVTTRENRGAKWQAPTPLKFAIPGASQEARFTQVCLTQNELHMFCTAALPKTANEEDVHPAVLSRKTPDGEFTSYQRLTLGNYARDISGWRAFRYCETTKEFVITDKGRKNDLFLVRNVSIPVVEEQAQSDKETGANEAAANWKFWDVFASGVKRNMLIVARDGMLLSPAHDKGFCLTTLKEYSEMDFRMEFQFQTGEGLANPYVGVVSTLPNPAASDWKQQIPRSIQIKLDPKNAGELVLPTADFKVKLNEAQKIHNARHIAPINKAEVKLREWNTLEVKCSEDSKLIIKINGVTVNRLEGMQTNKGHVVIWPANAEMRLRNAVIVIDSSETKLPFETLE